MPDRAIRDKDGKPLLSWRVALLPQFDQSGLYKEFHLDEPWDSEHNRKLIEQMPDFYRSPDSADLQPGHTRYLAVVGEHCAFPPDRPIKMKEISDGTSKTIMVVEADPDHSVIWTKPDDLEVDQQNPARGLAGNAKLFNAAFFDGHIEVFEGTMDPKKLWALFTRDGGESIQY
jgi:prepilin-type processing-associated H-X9-DG protein